MLDTILGNHPDIESVGELSNVVSSDWVAGAYCACGQRGEQCLFWRDVLRQWRTRCSLQDGPQFQALIEHWEQGRWAMNRVWQERRRPSAAFGAYLAGTRAVFEAIRATSGKSMIVDSSKSPARCLAISMVPGIDLRVIHLVRDARGVAWSGMKKVLKNERGGVARDLPVHRSWRVALGWVVTNSRAEWLCRRLDPARSCRVRYEDYVADPAGALSRIGCVLGADLGPLAAAAEAGQEM